VKEGFKISLETSIRTPEWEEKEQGDVGRAITKVSIAAS